MHSLNVQHALFSQMQTQNFTHPQTGEVRDVESRCNLAAEQCALAEHTELLQVRQLLLRMLRECVRRIRHHRRHSLAERWQPQERACVSLVCKVIKVSCSLRVVQRCDVQSLVSWLLTVAGSLSRVAFSWQGWPCTMQIENQL